jgi:hypothetical protein
MDMVCPCPVVENARWQTFCPDPDCTDFSDPRNFILIFWGNCFFFNHFWFGIFNGFGVLGGEKGGGMFYLCFYLSIFGG